MWTWICFFNYDLFCHQRDSGKRADTAKIQSLIEESVNHCQGKYAIIYSVHSTYVRLRKVSMIQWQMRTNMWSLWYSNERNKKYVSRSEIFLKTCFIAFSLALKTEWSTSFEFMFAFITSSRVGHVFQMWTSSDLRCAYARAYIHMLANTHTHTHTHTHTS